MHVIFTNGTDSRGADAQVTCRWVAPVAGEAGQATIRLPRRSPAASTAYIAPAGGSLVRVLGEHGCGDWVGIVLGIDDSDPAVIEIHAVQPSRLLGERIVKRTGVLRNLTAGMAATVVLREATQGVRGLRLVDAPFEGGVLGERDVVLDNQDAWAVLSELMDLSDGEVHITADGDVSWCGPLAHAPRYDALLVAGSSLRDATYAMSAEDRVAEVTTGSGPDRFTARAGDAARDGWPAQATIDGGGGPAGSAAAVAELVKRAQSVITIGGGVTSEHWAIRERGSVQVLVSHAAITGRLWRCRVLARERSDDNPLMRLQLQVIQPVIGSATSGGTGAGARQKPAQRASRAVADQSGSFAQRWRAVTRELARQQRGLFRAE